MQMKMLGVLSLFVLLCCLLISFLFEHTGWKHTHSVLFSTICEKTLLSSAYKHRCILYFSKFFREICYTEEAVTKGLCT